MARRRARAAAPAPAPAAPGAGHAVPVDPTALAPDNSYSAPEWLVRGWYEDVAFRCRDCGAEGVWSAEGQKWWYEVMRGGRWTRAIRCRDCRRAERERRAAARRSSLEGLTRKARLRAPHPEGDTP